jgi:predicted RNase H-like HicB family nuclease
MGFVVSTLIVAQERRRSLLAGGVFSIATQRHHRVHLHRPPRLSYNGFMEQLRRVTAIIEREDDGYVALCPEVDVASQGATIEEARENLIEALGLFFEAADPSEIARRLHSEVLVTQVARNPLKHHPAVRPRSRDLRD